MIKAKNWSGKDLKGEWEFTVKIDGVRALRRDGEWVSRNGKPLYNLPAVSSDFVGDFEVYCGGFKATIERVRAKTKDRPITASELFSLDPLDARLRLYVAEEPTKERIEHEMRKQIANGFEGLVLRQGDVWLKVKPTETFDVQVTQMVEGTGKHKGRMGALITEMGKVGTGFSDADREWWWSHPLDLAPVTIEVECMKLTDDGKFRHPRFVRVRPDK